MTAESDLSFRPRGTAEDIERGSELTPLFDAQGLIPAIVSDRATGEVLMFAYMNREALALTLATGYGHFYSRSRNRLWQKGEDSGNRLAVREIRTDCDQDVIWLQVEVEGEGVACHTGERSCFYRRVAAGGEGRTLEAAAAVDVDPLAARCRDEPGR